MVGRPRRDVKREKAAEANRLFRMAYGSQLDGNLDRALSLYAKSYKLHAKAETLVHLAWVKATQGELEEAVEHCREATSLDPNFPNTWNDLGAYLIELDRPDESLFFLKLATRISTCTTRSFPHYNLHRAYLALDDTEKAVEHLQEALEADPDFTPAMTALAELLFPECRPEYAADDLADCLRAGTPVLALPDAGCAG